jgi:L-alanine-DL-glutamate epimerase-like enolase superfamily enzyme
MTIDSVDLFYLSIPEVRDIGDGSQDALLVRVEADGWIGWGECEAAPLVCMASWNCPMSHSACKPVSASVLGQRLENPADIQRINVLVRAQSLDLLQADHTLSGVDVALWDLLGRQRDEPVWRLLGDEQAEPKTAYASQLFGDDPQATWRKAQAVARAGFAAAKFGWGPYGRGSVQADADHVHAAREGLGAEATLLVDAGTIWGDDVAAAQARLPALEQCRVLWLEEPFVSGALAAYRRLARRSPTVKLAGGEGCHNFCQAQNLIDYARLGFIQVDAGRIGGITTARQVADYARARQVQFVNHTFTTHLALSASLQPYAAHPDAFCEYPFEPSALARDLTTTKLGVGAGGRVALPEQPGLGLEPDLQALKKYQVEVEIRVAGRTVFPARRADTSGKEGVRE